MAHKKGMGSTKNGRDSESKRLGAKRADGQFVLAGKRFIPAPMSARARMIPCSHLLTVPLSSNAWARIVRKSPFMRSSPSKLTGIRPDACPAFSLYRNGGDYALIC